MPSDGPQSSSLPPHRKRELPAVLEAARPFLRGELEQVDPALPGLVAVLRSVGAGECWHKHGSFLDHLLEVYRILKLWSAPDDVARCGLFHSAYSNSYVNLAIFDPTTSRAHVRGLVGGPAERLVHLFCVVPRQPLIHDDLLFRYPSDAELVEHLRLSDASIRELRERGASDPEEPWRRKSREVIPPEGVTVRHIKTGEPVAVSRRMVAVFLLMTMADFSDQLFSFQDALFGNADGRLEFSGNNPTAVWPGDGKPGLWVSSISRMGAIYALIAREEEIYREERRRAGGLDGPSLERDEDIELVVPPVLEGCTRVLGAGEQIEARDMYWEAVCVGGQGGAEALERAEGLLRGCVERNPFVGEPHLVLGQVYLGQGRWEQAEVEAEEGLRLMLEWGSCWDKRMSWEGWVAWGRVLLMKARERSWPQSSWGVLNLGLVS